MNNNKKRFKSAIFAIAMFATSLFSLNTHAAFVATGYIYESSANMASIVVPDSIGDGIYSAYGWDGADYIFLLDFSFGTQVDLILYNATGFGKLKIDGIETSAMLDPTDPTAFITGLTFVSGGLITVTQTAIETYVPDNTSVPEASSLYLLAFGLLGLFGVARRKV